MPARTHMAALVAAALLLGGCPAGPGGGGGGGIGGDAGTALPGEASRVEIRVTPPRSAYHTEQTVELEASVFDPEGERVDDAELEWSVSPSGAISSAGGGQRYTLLREGTVTFEACTSSSIGPVCDTAPILVDADAPNLEVTSPEPGAELGGEGASTIEVQGSVADTRDVTVFVNGEPAEVDGMGMFRAEVPALFGVNRLDVVASDGVSPDSRVQMDVLWADRYLPAPPRSDGTRPSVVFEEGMTLQLGQRFFDDATPYDPTVTPTRTEDLADILALVLLEARFTSWLPDPFVDNAPTMFMRVTDVRVSDLDVTVDVVEGGAEIFVRVGSLEVDTQGSANIEGSSLSLDGGVTAGVSAFASIDASKDGPESEVVAEMDELIVAVESVEGGFASSEANSVLALTESTLRQQIDDLITEAMHDALVSSLPAILSSSLNGFDRSLGDQRLELDTEGLPSVTALIDGRLTSLDTSYRRWMRSPIRMSVGAEGMVTHPDTRGVPDLPPASETPLFETGRAQISVRLAVLNAALHSLWNTGLLEVDATTLLPEGVDGLVESATLSGTMPPIVRPARGGEDHELRLSVGQAELDLQTVGEHTRFGISIEAGTSIRLEEGRLGLTLAEEPELKVWVIESDARSPIIDEETLRSLLESEVWPSLRNGIVDNLHLTIPSYDLGDLTGLAPSLRDFRVQLQLQEGAEIRESHLVLDFTPVGTFR